MMDNDDRQIGRILSRREALAVLGKAGLVALLAACAPAQSGSTQPTSAPAQAASATGAGALPACIVSPALTEGPYFVDEKLNRSDIRSDPSDNSVKQGVPLELTLRVLQVSSGSCAPRAGVFVDIWHCDALGVYSDATDRSFNTKGKKFLRGYQTTDANGIVKFTTIYPGWYPGRAVHIHFKVRSDINARSAREFTSQFFFDEAVTAEVYKQPPYATKSGRRDTNASDGIYREGGAQLLLKPTKDSAGYKATFDMGLQL